MFLSAGELLHELDRLLERGPVDVLEGVDPDARCTRRTRLVAARRLDAVLLLARLVGVDLVLGSGERLPQGQPQSDPARALRAATAVLAGEVPLRRGLSRNRSQGPPHAAPPPGLERPGALG